MEITRKMLVSDVTKVQYFNVISIRHFVSIITAFVGT